MIFNTVVDFQFIDDPLFDEPLSSIDLAEIDAFCQTYFVSSVDSECEAGQVDEGVEVDEGGSSSCHKETHPDLMDNDRIHSFLEELKDTSTQASVSGSLAFKINNLIASLQQPESLPKVNRDYFMVGECVRFLFTSCEGSLNERVSAANE